MSAKRILLIDDNPAIVRLMSVVIGRQGFAVTTARNGAEALIKIRESRPDLIVTDYDMPEMNGLAFIEEFRQQPNSGIPVIFLSGDSDPANIEAARMAGADLCLCKPFSHEELTRHIRELLDASATEKEQ